MMYGTIIVTLVSKVLGSAVTLVRPEKANIYTPSEQEEDEVWGQHGEQMCARKGTRL